MTMYAGCAGLAEQVVATASHSIIHLENIQVVWASSSPLHASWEFLFPIFRWDPCPLKLQLLSDVFLLTLLEERWVLVTVEWKKVNGINVVLYNYGFDDDYRGMNRAAQLIAK